MPITLDPSRHSSNPGRYNQSPQCLITIPYWPRRSTALSVAETIIHVTRPPLLLRDKNVFNL